jgi:hypothetical protein
MYTSEFPIESLISTSKTNIITFREEGPIRANTVLDYKIFEQVRNFD